MTSREELYKILDDNSYIIHSKFIKNYYVSIFLIFISTLLYYKKGRIPFADNEDIQFYAGYIVQFLSIAFLLFALYIIKQLIFEKISLPKLTDLQKKLMNINSEFSLTKDNVFDPNINNNDYKISKPLKTSNLNLDTLRSELNINSSFLQSNQMDNNYNFTNNKNRIHIPSSYTNYSSVISYTPSPPPTVVKYNKSGMDSYLSLQLLKKLNITHTVDNSIDRIKKHLAFLIRKNLENLDKINGFLVAFFNNQISIDIFQYKSGYNCNVTYNGTVHKLESLLDKLLYSNLVQNGINFSLLIQERRKFERFLNISGLSYAAYILDRYRKLSSNDYMTDFIYDFKDSNYNSKLPSDAQIIMHYFVCYMDLLVENFSDHHFYLINSTLTNIKDILIEEVHTSPSHFNIRFNGEILTISAGRSNVFYTVVIFLHLIKTYLGDKLRDNYITDITKYL